MKKIITLISIYFVLVFPLTAQNLNWIKQVGSAGFDTKQLIATDNQGNIFISGLTSSNSINIFGTTLATPSSSIGSLFIVKCDSSANILWTNFYSTTGSNIVDLCVDRQGNCIAIGSLIHSLIIGNDTLFDFTSDPTGFMLSINSVGSLNWYRHFSSTCELNPRKVTTDYSGNIYTCGRFYCNGQFDTISVNTFGYENFFIAKFSNNGNGLWLKKGTGIDMLTLNCSSSGIIRACTQYYDSLTIDNTSIYANGSNENTAIIGYDSTGYLTLIMNIGHASNNTASSSVTGLSTDVLGNIYISGTFDSTNVFADTTISSYQDNDVFILKLNSDGSTFSFKRFGGVHNDLCRNMITDQFGVSYLCGSFEGAISFDGVWYFSGGTSGVFICRIDSSLNVDWVMHSDNNLISEASDLSLTPNAVLYATGTMNGPLEWGPWNLNTFGNEDIWVARISDITIGTGLSIKDLTQAIKIYPNPASEFISINGLPKLAGTLQVHNLQGKLLANFDKEMLTQKMELKLPFPPGMYLIEFVSDDKEKTLVGKIILN